MIEAATPERRPDQRTRAPWGPLEIVIVFVITIVALVFVSTVAFFVIEAFDIEGDIDTSPGGASILLISQFILDVIAVAVAAGFSLGKFNLPPAAWGLIRPIKINIGQVLLTLLGCFVALIAYGAVVAGLGLEFLEPEANIPESLFDQRSVLPLTLFLVLIVAPLAEEMFFRGFVFHGLWPRFPLWAAMLISGLLFSAIHVTGADMIGLLIPFTVIGALFAWIVQRTGSLWNAIAVHFLFNLIGVAGNLAQVILR